MSLTAQHAAAALYHESGQCYASGISAPAVLQALETTASNLGLEVHAASVHDVKLTWPSKDAEPRGQCHGAPPGSSGLGGLDVGKACRSAAHIQSLMSQNTIKDASKEPTSYPTTIALGLAGWGTVIGEFGGSGPDALLAIAASALVGLLVRSIPKSPLRFSIGGLVAGLMLASASHPLLPFLFLLPLLIRLRSIYSASFLLIALAAVQTISTAMCPPHVVFAAIGSILPGVGLARSLVEIGSNRDTGSTRLLNGLWHACTLALGIIAGDWLVLQFLPTPLHIGGSSCVQSPPDMPPVVGAGVLALARSLIVNVPPHQLPLTVSVGLLAWALRRLVASLLSPFAGLFVASMLTTSLSQLTSVATGVPALGAVAISSMFCASGLVAVKAAIGVALGQSNALVGVALIGTLSTALGWIADDRLVRLLMRVTGGALPWWAWGWS